MSVKKICLIEDDLAIRLVVGEILNASGFEVVSFKNGALAWSSLSKGYRPDLIILDLMMPVMNGRQFRAMQIKSPSLKDIPVMIMTAADSSLSSDVVFEGVRVVNKPVRIENILAKVKAELSSGSLSGGVSHH